MSINKDVLKYDEIRERISSGLNKLASPIIQTLTPKGRNVLVQDENGNIFLTRDGFTIARYINLEDPVENSVAEIVKQAAFETNRVAGDGTTTSVLLSMVLITDGFKVIDGGKNQIELRNELDIASKVLVEGLKSFTYKVSNDKQLHYIASVSSSNDPEITKNVVDAVKSSGEDGLVFIELNPQYTETKVVTDNGFIIDTGMFSHLLANRRGKFTASYEDVLVFITDKRIYYEKECIAILSKVASMGRNSVVIIAKDFIGEAPNVLIANHLNQNVNMNVLMVKAGEETLDDLADYLGGRVYVDKRGSIADKITSDDFVEAEKFYSDKERTIVVSKKKKNVSLGLRVKALKESLEKEESEEKKDALKKRIASLTNGITTIKVGAKTPAETQEKFFRYEDALNATRVARKDGYVVGGGLTLYNLYQKIEKDLKISDEVKSIIRNMCLAPIRQIAKNCNLHLPTVLENIGKNKGYNAITEKYEDLLKAGIIEPFLVAKHSIENSISVANTILSSDYMVLDKQEEKKEKHVQN